jgi:ATP-dependent RNA helicase DDX46/PRP5
MSKSDLRDRDRHRDRERDRERDRDRERERHRSGRGDRDREKRSERSDRSDRRDKRRDRDDRDDREREGKERERGRESRDQERSEKKRDRESPEMESPRYFRVLIGNNEDSAKRVASEVSSTPPESSKADFAKKIERLARVQAWKQQLQLTQPKKISTGLFTPVEETSMTWFQASAHFLPEKKLSLLDQEDETDYSKFKQEDEGEEKAVEQEGANEAMEQEAEQKPTEEKQGESEVIPEPPVEVEKVEEMDSLDAYMATIVNMAEEERRKSLKKATKEASKRKAPEIEDDWEERDTLYVSWPNCPTDRASRPKKLQKKVLEIVDHKVVDYLPFHKDFYIEVPEISRMTPEEVSQLRKSMDAIKIRGKGCPSPIKNFHQCGLKTKMYVTTVRTYSNYFRLQVLEKYGYEKPTPIQAQAIPAIMSGRYDFVLEQFR